MNRNAWVIGFIIAFLLALSITAIAPAQGHTDDQLDQWVENWSWDLWNQSGIDYQLSFEWYNMADRHPCYFQDVCPPPPPHTHQFQQARFSGGVEQWRTLVMTYFSGNDVDIAMRIIGCESRGNPSAKNPRSTAAGLWQFLRSTWDRAAATTDSPSYAVGGPYDPVWATINAAWLRARGSGWNQWECY